MEGDRKTLHWRTWLGWALFAGGAAEKLIGWGGSVDFIISRWSDPGWIGTVLRSVADHSALLSFVMLMAGFVLILWDQRRRFEVALERRLTPPAPTMGETTATAIASGSAASMGFTPSPAEAVTPFGPMPPGEVAALLETIRTADRFLTDDFATFIRDAISVTAAFKKKLTLRGPRLLADELQQHAMETDAANSRLGALRERRLNDFAELGYEPIELIRRVDYYRGGLQGLIGRLRSAPEGDPELIWMAVENAHREAQSRRSSIENGANDFRAVLTARRNELRAMTQA